MNRISLLWGDITHCRVDAIVNAANNRLLGGGGVDGAIHRAAGEELLQECRKLNGCNTGDAKLTKGYNLPAKYVIHTVGPVWTGGNSKEKMLLSNCYRNSLSLAKDNGFKTIAFPSVSTGIYGYPLNEAVKIALFEISDFLSSSVLPEKVTIVCFDETTLTTYQKYLPDYPA